MAHHSEAALGSAIVTGAGSVRGIGRGVAVELARRGRAVAVLDVDGAAADDAAAAVTEETGVRAIGVACDVTDEASVDTAVSRVEAELPPVAVLVNNAGVSSPVPFLEVDAAEFHRVFDVNVTGVFHVTRRVVPGLVDRGHGRVITLSSVSAQRGGGVFGAVPYSASKAAVLGLTRALARELAPHGVTVNAVAPGLIDTDITAGAMTDEARARVVDTIPVGRPGSVADVAHLIAFLADETSGYVTGATYDVNGGSHIH